MIRRTSRLCLPPQRARACPKTPCRLSRSAADRPGRQAGAQDLPDRSGGEKGGTKWFAGLEGISDLEYGRFGAPAIPFCRLPVVCVTVQLPSGRVGLPSRNQDLEFLDDRYSFLDMMPRCSQVLLSDGHACLELPSEGLQMRIGRRKGGLQKAICRRVGIGETSRR